MSTKEKDTEIEKPIPGACPHCGESGPFVYNRSYDHDKPEWGCQCSWCGLLAPVAVWNAAIAKNTEIARLKARLEELEPLVYAVGNKYPGESRIETALRYIRQAERLDDMQPQQESKK